MYKCLQCSKYVLAELLARHGVCFECCVRKASEAPVICSQKWVTQSPFISQDDSEIKLNSRCDSSIDWCQLNTMSYAQYQERLNRMFNVPVSAINGGRKESCEDFLHIREESFEGSKKDLVDLITKMTAPELLDHYKMSHCPHDELSNLMAAGFLFAPICFDLDTGNPQIFRVAGTWRKANGELGGCNNPCGSWWALNICKSLMQHRHIYAVQLPWNAIGGVTTHTLSKNSVAIVSLVTPQTTKYHSHRYGKDCAAFFCGGGIQLNYMRTVNPRLPLNFVYKNLYFPQQPEETKFLQIERYFEIAIIVQSLKFLSAQKVGMACPTTPISLKELITHDINMISVYPQSLRLELGEIIHSYFCTIFKIIDICSDDLPLTVQQNQAFILNFLGSRYRRMTELLLCLSSPSIPDVKPKLRDCAYRALYKHQSTLLKFRRVVLLAVNRAIHQRLSGEMPPFHAELM